MNRIRKFKMNTKWQKESKHKNALYTNICVSNVNGQQLNDIYREVRAEINAHKELKLLYVKLNKVAKEKRKLDIKSFFKELASHIQIDRRFFFNLKAYEKCLVHIELAKLHNYCINMSAVINLFGSADEMMEFVEVSLADIEIPIHFDDERLRYRTFSTLVKNNNISQTGDDQFA